MAEATAADLGLFLLRAVIGFTMLAHGYNHVWGGGKIEGTARWFASLGMKPGIVHAWLASITELVCGPMLIVGFLNPLAAAGVVGVMSVAFTINHRPNGFFIFRPGEGYEYVLNLGVAALALAALGPGAWSVDHALGLDLSGWKGLAIGAVAGVGGAAFLLVAFWRPEPKVSESAAS
ncbi:MAG: DoxX family protein [Acidimicrobiales bacterium]|nr:DoxX family protein [Acidimicrobiales bacterium]